MEWQRIFVCLLLFFTNTFTLDTSVCSLSPLDVKSNKIHVEMHNLSTDCPYGVSATGPRGTKHFFFYFIYCSLKITKNTAIKIGPSQRPQYMLTMHASPGETQPSYADGTRTTPNHVRPSTIQAWGTCRHQPFLTIGGTT